MAYPPVPYPPLLSASPATTAASSERANPASPAPSRDHASSSSIAPAPSSLSLSRSPATSVPQESPQASSSVTEPSSPLSQLSKLSTPFRFPRPTYSPDTPASPPRLTLVTETAHDFLQKLMRTRTLESPVRESGEKSEFATKYPGQFGTFKTPTKSNMGEDEPEGGEETGKRKKRKRVEGSLVKDGSSLEGIDHSSAVNGKRITSPHTKAQQPGSSSTQSLVDTNSLNQTTRKEAKPERSPFRSPRRDTMKMNSSTDENGGKDEKEDEEDELLVALDRVIEGKFPLRSGCARVQVRE